MIIVSGSLCRIELSRWSLVVSQSLPEGEEMRRRRLNLYWSWIRRLTCLELVVVLLVGLNVLRVRFDGQGGFRSVDISQASGLLWCGTLNRGLDASGQRGGMREERR